MKLARLVVLSLTIVCHFCSLSAVDFDNSMPRLNIATLSAALSRHEPLIHTEAAEQFSAVAVILREHADDIHALMIRRAERIGDPWSGHLAFPGGHFEIADSDLIATAIRETREELGVEVDERSHLAQLSDLRTHTLGRFVRPQVFHWREAPPRMNVPNNEVAAAFWVPLRPLKAGLRNAQHEKEHDGRRVRFPAYDVGEGLVWGLSHRILQELFAIVK